MRAFSPLIGPTFFVKFTNIPIATLACLFQVAGLKLKSQKLNQICSEKLAFEMKKILCNSSVNQVFSLS
jgi:hypothetical protein